MTSVIKDILVGNLGADPELQSFPKGDRVCILRLAKTDSWKDNASREKREATEWYRFILYLKLAEIAGQYLSKRSRAPLARPWLLSDRCSVGSYRLVTYGNVKLQAHGNGP